MAAAKKDEGKLRKDVEQTQAKVNELRDRYAKKPTDQKVGKQLLAARQKASVALQALWDAVPDEKPPSQSVM